MTTRLYWEDAYRTEFDATVVRRLTSDGRPAVVLDRTLFYPDAGGQPPDQGMLGEARVIGVAEEEGGDIVHVLDRDLPAGPLAAQGESVHGAIDGSRRFDHMQQHTGQHLLSQSFVRTLELDTVSVRIGARDTTIDLAGAPLAQPVLDDVERFACSVIYENRPVRSFFATEEEVGRLPLRRAPAMRDRIRVVEIDGFDWSACGGTHLRATGEIGAIKIMGQERRGDLVRISFRCGRRAADDHREKHRQVVQAMALLSVPEEQVGEAVAERVERTKALQRQVAALAESYLPHEARELHAQAEHLADVTLVKRLFGERPAKELAALAAKLQQETRTVVLLAAPFEGKLQLVFARSKDVAGVDLGTMLRRAVGLIGGRGGGRPEFAQGGGPVPADPVAVLDEAARDVRSLLP